MNRKQALAEAARRWGKRAAVRDEGKPTSKAQRDASMAELKRLREAMAAAVRGSDEWRAIRDQVHEQTGRALHYRYCVGYVGGIAGFSFFSVQGQGDTWDEAFAAAGVHHADIEGRTRPA